MPTSGRIDSQRLFLQEITAKRLGLLHELVPKAARIAVVINPANTPSAEAALRDIPEAARAMGLQIQIRRLVGRLCGRELL